MAMNETAIIWTEVTWNPFSGCRVITEGCKFCYAKTLAENKRGTKAFPNGFDLTLRPHKLVEPKKLKTPSLIFVNSMSDLFFEDVPGEYRDMVFDVMRETPQHQYQVLTKRPELMREYARTHAWPGNVWAGVTIENQRCSGRLDVLRDVEAEIRFVSAEPLLGPLALNLTGIHWLISGGESGSHLSSEEWRERRGLIRWDTLAKRWIPREDRIDWIRALRDQCIRQGTKFLHKQWGGPQSHSAGRVLDGRTWDEFPRLPQAGNWREGEKVASRSALRKRQLPLLQTG